MLALLGLVAVLVILLISGIAMYVTYRHPVLTPPWFSPRWQLVWRGCSWQPSASSSLVADLAFRSGPGRPCAAGGPDDRARGPARARPPRYSLPPARSAAFRVIRRLKSRIWGVTCADMGEGA